MITTRRTHTELSLGPVESLRLSVLPHPGATLLSLVADALGGRRQGVPEHWRRAVRATVPASARAVLRPLFAPDYSVIPDCLTPTASLDTDSAAHHLDALGAVSADVLLRELETDFEGAVPPQWRPVVDRPRQWLDAYTRLMRTVWREFERTSWRAGERLIRRETERVGAAAVSGALDVVLAGLSPRFRYADGVLHLPDLQGRRVDVGGRRLVLVPIAAGSGASVFAFDLPDTVWIGYPLPGLGLLWGGAPNPPAAKDALATLLGPARAMVLRSLRVPVTMGEIASALESTPATATYHCGQLEAAGLAERERRGRHVLMRRTERGDALVDLLL